MVITPYIQTRELSNISIIEKKTVKVLKIVIYRRISDIHVTLLLLRFSPASAARAPDKQRSVGGTRTTFAVRQT